MARFISGRGTAALVAAALAGALALPLLVPVRYVSEAVLRLPAGRRGARFLSPGMLAAAIERAGLYPRDRLRLPMLDLIDRMRGDLAFHWLRGDTWAVRFVCGDADSASRGLRAVAARMATEGVAVLKPPSSGDAEHPTRTELAAIGFGGGFLLALFAIGLRSRRVRAAAASALAGAALAAAGSLLLPRTYVSTARIAASAEPALSREAATEYLAPILKEALDGNAMAELRKRIRIAAEGPDEFTISVAYPDAAKARQINRELITEIIEAAVMRQRHPAEPESGPPMPPVIEGIQTPILPGEANSLSPPVKMLFREWAKGDVPAQTKVEPFPPPPPGEKKPAPRVVREGVHVQVMDAASLPDSPSSPNRPAVSLAGLALGLLAGIVGPWRPRPRPEPGVQL